VLKRQGREKPPLKNRGRMGKWVHRRAKNNAREVPPSDKFCWGEIKGRVEQRVNNLPTKVIYHILGVTYRRGGEGKGFPIKCRLKKGFIKNQHKTTYY